MNKSKAKGTSWETAVVTYLRQWWPTAERRALAGAKDLGDVINVPFICECKSARRFELSQWMNELAEEKKNANEVFGILVVKRPNHNVSRAYAVMELHDMMELLARRELPNDRDDGR